MINEEKVRLMTKLALYEKQGGDKDIKVSEYYRKDYTSFHTIISLIWVTLGYALLLGMFAIIHLESLLDKMSQSFLIVIGASIVIGYIIVLFVYGMIAFGIYRQRHNNARHRVKRYNRDLIRLIKMQDRENKSHE